MGPGRGQAGLGRSRVMSHPALFVGHCQGMPHPLKVRLLPGHKHEGAGKGVHTQPYADTTAQVHAVTFPKSPALRAHAQQPHVYIHPPTQPRPPALAGNGQVFLQVKSWLRLPRGTTSVRY